MDSVPPPDHLSVSGVGLPIGDTLALITLIIVAVYIVFSVILHYHWKNFATDDNVKKMTLLLYFASTIPLIIVMAVIVLFVI